MASTWGFPDWEDALGGISSDGSTSKDGLSEREAHNSHKTEEEIDQYSVAEDLNDVDLCAHLIRSGLPVQKLSALRRLPVFFNDLPAQLPDTTTASITVPYGKGLVTADFFARNNDPLADMSPLHTAYTDEELHANSMMTKQEVAKRDVDRQKLLQLVLNLLPRESSAFREGAARSFRQILVAFQLDEATVDKILQVARKCIHVVEAGVDSRDLWLTIIEQCIPYASLKLLETELLPEVMVNGGHAQPAKLRQASCRLIGPLAGRLPENGLAQKLHEKAIALCQDTDHEVRLLMCAQLYRIVRVLSPDNPLLHDILEEYVELLSDDAPNVREAAVTNYINMMPSLPSRERHKYCVVGVRKMGVERHPAIARIILHRFGEIFCYLQGIVNEEDRSSILSIFLKACTAEDATHRLECAYNLPAIVHCLGVTQFVQTNMSETIKLLSEDTDENVRQKVALGFHEICRTLGNASYQFLQETFTRLLVDGSTKVSLAMFSKLSEVLQIWTVRGKVDTEPYIDMLLQKEQEHVSSQSLQWRHHHDLLLQFSAALYFSDHDVLFDKVVPILQKRAHETKIMVPTRSLILRLLCSYAKHLNRTEYRDKVLISIKDEFGRDRSYLYRIAFLKFCQFAMNEFSLKFIRNNLANDISTLCEDFVVNVRHKAVIVLKLLVKMVRQLGDNSYSDQLKSFVKTRLAEEKDRDVLFQLLECDGLWTSVTIVGLAIKTETERSQYEAVLIQQEMDYDEAKKRREMEDARHEVSQRIAKSEKAAAKAAMVGKKPTQSTTAAMAIANKAVESNKIASANIKSASSTTGSNTVSIAHLQNSNNSVSIGNGMSVNTNSHSVSISGGGSIIKGSTASLLNGTTSPTTTSTSNSFSSLTNHAGHDASVKKDAGSSRTTDSLSAKKATTSPSSVKLGASQKTPSVDILLTSTNTAKKYVTGSSAANTANLSATKQNSSSTFVTPSSSVSSLASSSSTSEKSVPRYMQATTSSHRSVTVPSSGVHHVAKK